MFVHSQWHFASRASASVPSPQTPTSRLGLEIIDKQGSRQKQNRKQILHFQSLFSTSLGLKHSAPLLSFSEFPFRVTVLRLARTFQVHLVGPAFFFATASKNHIHHVGHTNPSIYIAASNRPVYILTVLQRHLLFAKFLLF